MTAGDGAHRAAGLPPRPAAVSTCPWDNAGGSFDRLARKPAKNAEPTSIWGGDPNQENVAIKKSAGPSFEGCAGSGAPRIGEGTPRGRNGEQPTCPWLGRAEDPRKGRGSSSGVSQKATSPWECTPTDRDSRVLADAAAKRNRGAVDKFEGRAGSGAPRSKPGQAMQNQQPQEAQFECATPAELQEEDLAQAALNANGGDNEHAEIRGIIDRCLENGLDREQINEVIEEYRCMKMVEKQRAQQEQTIKVAPSKGQQMSVAAQRQKQLSARRSGPSDQEIVNILNTHTPPETPDGGNAMAAQRMYEAGAVSAPYAESKQAAANARDKNRGSGIF